jgi:hypothetical protein
VTSWVEGGLERGGNLPEGHRAPERGGNSPEGHQALERDRGFMVRRLALERGGGSPEGYRDWMLDRPLRLFWAVGLSLPWAATPRGVHSWFVDSFVRFLLFYRKGRFVPVIRGPLWPSPADTKPRC